MKDTRKIIACGNYWVCENMDTLAPICETGYQYLLSDGSRVNVQDDVEDDNKKLIESLEIATKEEQKLFASQKYGIIFKGDKVVINRGRKMRGEVKQVKGFFRYDIKGTYHQCVDYLTFTDGNKCNILNCDVLNVDHKDVYRRYQEELNCLTFSVGGRL